jgi:hypothetical protein
VLSGQATVTGRRGAAILKQGQGTMLFSDGRPQRPAGWPTGRMKRAVASITFGELLGDLKPRLFRRELASGGIACFDRGFTCHLACRD